MTTRKNVVSKKRQDRAHAFCLVFQLPFMEPPFGGEVAALAIDNYYQTLEGGKKGIDGRFVKDNFCGVISRLDEIDELLKKALNEWDLSRVAVADLAILRLGVFELLNGKTPQKVAINEAVELAKIYCAAESPKFINGVLGGVMNKMEEDEK